MLKSFASVLVLSSAALVACDNPFAVDFPAVDPCGGGPCNDPARYNLFVNETTETVGVEVVEAPPDLAFETRVLNPHPDAPLLEKIFAGRPRTTTLVPPGGMIERRGEAQFLSSDTAFPAFASLVTVSAPGREAATFVVAGFGRAPIRVSGRRLAVVIDPPNEVLFATEVSRPERPACDPTVVTSPLRWSYERPLTTHAAVTSQTWTNGCLSVAFADASALALCIPEEAWPFAIGDELQVIDTKGVANDPARRGVVADELVLIGRKHSLSLLRASATTSRIAQNLIGVELAFTNAPTCVTLDEDCGDARHPVTMELPHTPPVPIERGVPFVDPASPHATYWIVSAYASPIVRTSCGDGKDRPAAGLRVDVVKRESKP